MTSPFNKPTPSDGIKWAPLKGALLIIEPLSVETGIKTVHGDASAVKANVSVVTGDLAGTVYNETLIFPKLLQSAVKGSLGGMVLGRLGQGYPKPGQSAPWVLEDATGNAGDVKAAEAFLSSADGGADSESLPY